MMFFFQGATAVAFGYDALDQIDTRLSFEKWVNPLNPAAQSRVARQHFTMHPNRGLIRLMFDIGNARGEPPVLPWAPCTTPISRLEVQGFPGKNVSS